MRDETAASPLVVILTFVLVAIALTTLGYALLFDRPEPRLQLVPTPDGDGFDVTHAGGSLAWDEITLRFLDRAGTDHAATFLQPPTGDVDVGDRITLNPQPPAGSYVLLVLHDGDELSRVTIDL